MLDHEPRLTTTRSTRGPHRLGQRKVVDDPQLFRPAVKLTVGPILLPKAHGHLVRYPPDLFREEVEGDLVNGVLQAEAVHEVDLEGVVVNGELANLGDVDIGSGTLEAIFRLSNEELQLRPGMRAEFSIITSLRENVMAVPRAAVQGDPANRVVYIPHEELEHTFIRSQVVTGAQNDQYIEIVSGIFPGDPVVTTGSYFLGATTGGMSLKEALDAAHGHEHNEDGSIMTDDQKAARDAAKGIGHEEAKDTGPRTLFFSITTIVFFFLLVLSGIKHLRDGRYIAELSQHATPAEQPPPPPANSSDPQVGEDVELAQKVRVPDDQTPVDSTQPLEVPNDPPTPAKAPSDSPTPSSDA